MNQISLTIEQTIWLSDLLLSYQSLETTEHYHEAMAANINSELLAFLPL